MKPVSITSASNPLVRAAARLRDQRERRRSGLFLVEGAREVARALTAGVRVETLFVCPELFTSEDAHGVVARAEASGARVVELPAKVFGKVSYRDRPDGLVAVAAQFETSLERLGDAAFVLAVEAIEKPGNLGAMLRTADAFGVEGVIVCDQVTDVFNPNVVRASLGALFTLPVAVAPTDAAIAWARARGARIVAATPAGETPLWDSDLRGAIVIAVGSESEGLTDAWLKAADRRVSIPMFGTVDSLNAATSAAVIVAEARRQRSDGDAVRAPLH